MPPDRGGRGRARARARLATGGIYRKRQATGQTKYAAEAEAQGMHASRELKHVGHVPAPAHIAERLGCDEGTAVILRRQLFLIDGQPMQTTDAYYPAELVAGTPIEQRSRSRAAAFPSSKTPPDP